MAKKKVASKTVAPEWVSNPAQLVRPAGGERKLILGLDLGTSTGYSFILHRPGDGTRPDELENRLFVGQWDLSRGSYDSGAIRFLRLRQFLCQARPDLIMYERVRYTPAGMGRGAAIALARAATSMELFGAFFATMVGWAEEFGVPCEGVSIQEIKKRACGKANVNKEDMIKAAVSSFGLDLEVQGYESSGHDNIADASFVSLIALERYGDALFNLPQLIVQQEKADACADDPGPALSVPVCGGDSSTASYSGLLRGADSGSV